MRPSKYCVFVGKHNGVEVWVEAQPEDITPGMEARNIGGGEHGKQFVQNVRELRKHHGRWGWCTIAVHVVEGKECGTAYLGACSYKDAWDFKGGAYFKQKVIQALEELRWEQMRVQAWEDWNYV